MVLFYLLSTMPLTLNQFILLVITIAVVVAVTFLVIFMTQLRKTAREGEETLKDLRSLIQNLNQTNQKLRAKVEDVGEIVEATKNAASSFSEILWFLTAKIIKPTSRYWPFIFPFIRLGWRQLRKKKRKEEKDGK